MSHQKVSREPGVSIGRMLVLNTVAGALLPLLVLWLDRSWSWASLRTTFLYSMIYSHAIGTMVTVALTVSGPILARMQRVPAWLTIIGELVVCSFVGCGLATALIFWVGMNRGRSYGAVFWDSFQFSLPICLIIGIAAGAVADVRDRLRTTALQLKTNELERERAERLAMEARLSSLESRVQPHFLFNALNSATALVRENPAAAERLLERLAALLRFSLDSHAGLVPLGNELKVVTDYLEIEKARFGDRLTYRIDAPPALRSTEVPAMSVQTLVENSVKYAVAPNREGGTIAVTVCEQDGALRILVRDSGPGFTLADMRQGHGLDLVQSRLRTAFGTGGRLDIEGTVVIVTVPARMGAAA